jgi:hypothetical protein
MEYIIKSLEIFLGISSGCCFIQTVMASISKWCGMFV